jgi:2',3'-cyclic-nucleotide 2'-phosphodiesterase (5'-nucleotidase family)
VIAFAALAVASPWAHARPLQIIHTNDLHSHLDHAMDPARGNYAAVKATIDKLKWEARNRGIDTLVIDAGDFLEASEFYLADHGAHAWNAMNAMGYDAVVIGNHDWLAGPAYLDEMVGTAKPAFAFLGANFLFGWENPNLVNTMRKSLEIKRAGARIAIYGLTTDEAFYSWMAKPGSIYKPSWTAREDLPELRSRNDYVIALTHLGVQADRYLVSSVRGLDLVVGGHSHTALKEPVIQKDLGGKSVPIVQAGEHGEYVGDLLVDVEPGKPLQILRYQLVKVFSDGAHDAEMDKVIRVARERLDANYGAAWLSEVVGRSEVPLENSFIQGRPTVWSDFVAESIREGGKADVSLDAGDFQGFEQPAGPITREKLFVLYPRILEFDRRLGYTIWTTIVKGWVLKFALKESIGLGMSIGAAGIDIVTGPDGKPKDFLVDGRPIVAMRDYKVAMPEVIARGAFGTTQYLRLAFRNARDTGLSIWTANEQHLKRIGGVIKGPVRKRR